MPTQPSTPYPTGGPMTGTATYGQHHRHVSASDVLAELHRLHADEGLPAVKGHAVGAHHVTLSCFTLADVDAYAARLGLPAARVSETVNDYYTADWCAEPPWDAALVVSVGCDLEPVPAGRNESWG